MQINRVFMQIKNKHINNLTEDNTLKHTKVNLFQMWSSKKTNNLFKKKINTSVNKNSNKVVKI